MLDETRGGVGRRPEHRCSRVFVSVCVCVCDQHNMLHNGVWTKEYRITLNCGTNALNMCFGIGMFGFHGNPELSGMSKSDQTVC